MPSPLAELGLDIKPYKKALNEAKIETQTLEVKVRSASAELALMERAFAKLGNASGITTKQIDKQAEEVENLRAQLKGARSDAKAFEQGLGGKAARRDNIFTQIRNVVTAGVLTNFAKDIATAGREGDTLTKTLNDINYSSPADSFDKSGSAARGLKGRLLDLIAAAKNVPILGDAIGIGTSVSGYDAEIARAKALIDTSKAIGESVGNQSEAIANFRELTAMRAKLQQIADNEASIGEVSVETASQLKNIDGAREGLAKNIVQFAKQEAEARDSALAGSILQSKIAGIELEKRAKIAALQNSVKDANGNTTASGRDIVRNGSAQINREAEEAIELAKDQAQLQASATKAAKDLADLQLRGAQGEVTAAQKLVDLAKERVTISLGQAKETQDQEKANLAIAEDRLLAAKQNRDAELRAAELIGDEMEARIKGLDQLANRIAIEARYQQQITAAMQGGNEELVERLKHQKELALIEEKAREHDVTPKERREAARRARTTNRKANQQDAREDELRRRAARGIRGTRIDEQIAKDRNARGQGVSGGITPEMRKAYEDVGALKTAIVDQKG